MNQIPEIIHLREAVEGRFGAEVKTSRDFELLSAAMSAECGDALGATTLKRLWGYVPSETAPRLSSLDLLASYVGCKNFKEFCDKVHAEFGSEFLAGNNCITTAELSDGDHVVIGWEPERLVEVAYLGKDRFEVIMSKNSKLQKGDVFEASCFMKGWPLLVPWLLRGGIKTPPYIAGKAHGLTLLEKI